MAEDTGYFPDMMPLPDVPAPEDADAHSFPEMMALPDVPDGAVSEMPDMPLVEEGFPAMMNLPEVGDTQVQGGGFAFAADDAADTSADETFPPMLDLPPSESGGSGNTDSDEIVQALGSIQQTLMQMQVTLDRIAEL